MNNMEDVVLNLILVMFPVLVYFIYNCYRKLKCEKYNNLLLDVSLVSSMYLCFKFGNIEENNLGLLFCNLPIVVAYLKNQSNVALLLSGMVVMYSYYYFDISILWLILKYGCYLGVYCLGKKRKIKDNTFIISIVVLQGFFLSFEYFYRFSYSDLGTLIEILIMMMLFYLLPFLLLYLFKLADQVTSLHLTVSELEKDKQIKNSLFKITHEVKNPIAVCKGYLDMLDVYDIEKAERYIPIIRQEMERSLDIMQDFMEFSKIKIDKEIIDVNMLLEEIEDDLQLLINSKNVSFSCKTTLDEVYVEGDYNRLKQVFINMVKNSLEAIEGEGKIEIVARVLKGCYYIEIIDNGCGMDAETLSKVKEMFFTTKVKGSGLGVSLSNEIIKAHQGSIDYSSKEGIGTKVIVKLPVVVL
ncbi:MAG: HAMP domain-containing histidine kinase [Bacilli bacterium]|nr:HAMP domain-containing histidine kinase [Bacilli bacterium]